MTARVPAAWAHLPFFAQQWPRIETDLRAEIRPVLPPEPRRFAALDLTRPDEVRAVILGQDPYPTPGHANGLAFSVEPDIAPLPKSLANIFREMHSDLGTAPRNGDLRHLARQGVLLLNTVLSVPAGCARGHVGLGWQRLASEVLAEVAARPIAFLLWGRDAWAMAPADPSGHLVLYSTHPSPLGAANTRARHPPFLGSRPFSAVNLWLAGRNRPPIDWAGP
ncbi:MAG: uracil-DNA glycosylase [Rhodobacteraceae bacterium]|nr:uracil-DNA glycosylase [Paracoccaceae bacterium]MCP5341874.1 uracil-DNA glycosylase [Paracoccaceae bacterium]